MFGDIAQHKLKRINWKCEKTNILTSVNSEDPDYFECRSLRGMGTLSKMGTLSELFLPPF